MISTFKLYGILIMLAVITLVAGGIYAKGRIDSTHAAELQDAQHKVDAANAQVAQMKLDLEAAEQAAEQDRLQALQDAKDKDQRNAFAASQAPLLADANRLCFDALDADRVRSLYAHP